MYKIEAKGTMGDGKVSKIDPSTEIFQMRAQEAKVEICRKAWHDRWAWLVDEGEKKRKEMAAVRAKFGAALPTMPQAKLETEKSLKPVPQTSSGMYGWVANKPGFQLEKSASWMANIPIKAPDAWDFKSYTGKKDT